MIRISDKVSSEDKMKQLDEVVEALGLKNCLDTSKDFVISNIKMS
jgi:hypothetical protein